MSDSDVSQIDFDLLKCIDVLKLLLSSPFRQLPPELEDAMWRTMVGNQDRKSNQEAPQEVQAVYLNFIQWYQHLRSTQCDSISGTDPAWEARYKDFKRAVDVARGYAGQVPYYAEVGDIIAIVCGAPEPYILQARNGAFEWIRKAYTHGLMNDEALKLGIDSRDIEIV